MTQIDLSLLKKFARESAETLAHMKATDKGHALADVRVYFEQLKKYRQGQGGRPSALQPKKNVLNYRSCWRVFATSERLGIKTEV